jgi:cellulose synthase/poly-beta-1,6-N-acetylglucosamine synthase-like glycosyltransferase
MTVLHWISWVLFLTSALGISAVTALYPAAARALSRFRKQPNLSPPNGTHLRVTLLVVVRNAEALIGDKVDNALSLDYPRDRLDIVFFSDGSTDRTEEIIRARGQDRVRLVSCAAHLGKIRALNEAMHGCNGDIIVFSDADALLSEGALRTLVRHFEDPTIGGVCGQRVIRESGTQLREAQRDYIRFDSAVKVLETQIGSISSNDGKLYAIRRDLFQPIAEAVTDDLFVALSVVSQRRRFIYDPEALAYIRTPSRDRSHELARRRRIVSTSLRGIYLMKRLLNPIDYGFFAVSLAVNKILRRLVPVFLIVLLVSSLLLAMSFPVMLIPLLGQLLVYGAALVYPSLPHRHPQGLKPLYQAMALCHYFCLGNYGTLLGLIDFLRGRRITKWEPVKTDA